MKIINTRMFATGQLDRIDQIGNINVVFSEDFMSQEEIVIIKGIRFEST